MSFGFYAESITMCNAGKCLFEQCFVGGRGMMIEWNGTLSKVSFTLPLYICFRGQHSAIFKFWPRWANIFRVFNLLNYELKASGTVIISTHKMGIPFWLELMATLVAGGCAILATKPTDSKIVVWKFN
jgi:hypothetical protein